MKTIYCNPKRSDGFGAQFQNIIWTYIYCKMNDFEFYYLPFSKMEHNYDNDKYFIKNKEYFINFDKHFNLANNNYNQLDTKKCYKFIEENINTYHFIKNLNVIKNIFYKNKINPYDKDVFNIALHIRMPNSHDNGQSYGYIFDKNYYLNIINKIVDKYNNKNIKIHIFSQGKIENFEEYKNELTQFYLNEDVESTFLYFCFADILITSKSSLSYTAALLNNNEIYYTKFWHPPLKNWNII